MENSHTSLTKYARLSIAASLAVLALKFGAYLLTDSVGLLSDAVETLVNLFAALMAFAMLQIAARPEDDKHPFGHTKAEYFSSGMEGTLILVASISIAVAAIERLRHPMPLKSIGAGMFVSFAATLINFLVARILLRAGKKHHSITLEADGSHLMTDVWTSVGVLLGVGATALTRQKLLDPLIALAVAANIVRTGIHFIRRSVAGLMDAALPQAQQDAILRILDSYKESQGVEYHALRTRQAASRQFVSVHLLFPGAWTIHDAHEVAEKVEGDIRAALPRAVVSTHLEPVEDECSHQDIYLDR